MNQEKPISMKSLGEKKMSNIKIIMITILITVSVVLSGKYVYETVTTQEVDKELATKITLEDVIIAYAPETKSIIFLDRTTGTVKMALSDSVSLAISSLKLGELVTDYNSKVTN